MNKVLVIDDDRMIRHIVSSGLQGFHDISVMQASDGSEGLAMFQSEAPRVVLLDVMLPEYNGLELFRMIKAVESRTPVIFITSDTSSETAIQAMSAGAFDYLAKPLAIEQLRSLTLSALRARQAMDQPVGFNIGEGVAEGERFIGRSKAMMEVYKSIGRVAAQNVTVLVRGESGCGKELVARALFENSDRRNMPFVAVNCAAIPDQLLESELFGHEKGAFTGAEKRRIGRFEQCDGGTIFLDEVGDMTSIIQGKVLRLLQEQRFERVGGNEIVKTNVRIIAATNRPLEKMVEEGQFREDLFYRLNGYTIDLPPLRHRPEDVPLLLEYFFRRAKHDMARKDLLGVSPDALALLTHYDWPGNVRQLQSTVRHSVLNSTGAVIVVDNLPPFVLEHQHKLKDVSLTPEVTPIEATESTHVLNPPNSEAIEPRSDELVSNDEFSIPSFVDERVQAGSVNLYSEVMEEVERRLFARVLSITGGNQSKAAEILGITRGKVRDRVANFGIQFARVVSVANDT